MAALAAPLAFHTTPARSQGRKPRRVVFLSPATQAGYQGLLDAFRAELKQRGHVEGADVLIEARFAEHSAERLAVLAAEAAKSKPDVIVTHSSSGVAAVKKATSAVPVVFATGANPVEQGFVASLQRPGGNITGVVTFADLTQKLVELAREAMPKARRIALLVHENDPTLRFSLPTFEPAARKFGFQGTVASVSRPEELAAVFKRLAGEGVDAVIAQQLAFFTSHRKQLAAHALAARIPLLTASSAVAEAGALLSYGNRTEENYRRAAVLVDKILRGAKPADLPVEQPERFVLTVNRTTAKAIGVELSPLTMLRADRVID